MPVIQQFKFQESNIFVWKITEQIEDFSNLDSFDIDTYEKLIHPTKQLEWIVSRKLIEFGAETLGIQFSKIKKDKFGKLHFEDSNWQFSISHSKDLTAVIFHQTHRCGIDLEAESNRFFKVSPRVLSKTELDFVANDLTKHCIVWSAKEAIYKLHGQKNIDFKENLLIDSFEIMQNEAEFKGVLAKDSILLNCSFKALKANQLWLVACVSDS
jgi:4'-phosphopantetheinyl transferase